MLSARDISSDIAPAEDENERQRTRVSATRRSRQTVGAPRLGQKRPDSPGFQPTESRNPTLSAGVGDSSEWVGVTAIIVAWWGGAAPTDGSRYEARRTRPSMSESRATSPPAPAPLDVSRRSSTSLPVLHQGQIAVRFRLKSERNGMTRIARSMIAGGNTSRSADPTATVLSDSTAETLNGFLWSDEQFFNGASRPCGPSAWPPGGAFPRTSRVRPACRSEQQARRSFLRARTTPAWRRRAGRWTADRPDSGVRP
jgi:hypothetical protein